MYEFDYLRPRTLHEAIEALRGEDVAILSGGQTLIPVMKQRLASPSLLVDVSKLAELRGIDVVGEAVHIGAATRHTEIAENPDIWNNIPALRDMAAHIGDPQVRNRGTIGGSLANNDPAACYPSAVLALGATIVTDRREVAADAFFAGLFTTVLEENELITRVIFPIPAVATYRKAPQPASRFAMTGAFVARMRGEEARVGITGAGEDGVFRWFEAEEALSADWSALLDDLNISPPMLEDMHADGEYRANLVRVMTDRARQDCSERAG